MFVNQSRIERIDKLQYEPERIRNISIVAHVDHGKTTLADSLISSNGIISKKLAGKLRYMDDRKDEQDRQITMKSSSIALIAQKDQEDYLINLIDSPGHVQFGFEVSAALRLTDGALVVVDVMEGVSSQTYRVLLQTFQQKIACILVLNKIDKLIREGYMSPLEAFRHMTQIIEQVNAILGSFIGMQSVDAIQNTAQQIRRGEKEMDKLQLQYYFSVQKGNVVFCSALDGWAFTTKDFSPLISKKLGIDEGLLLKNLWGQFYYNPKTKTFSDTPRHDNDRPLCVDMILQSIWNVYLKVFEKDVEKIDKIISFFGLKISDKIKNTFDFTLVKEILTNWLPLDKVLFRTVIQVLPNPKKAQCDRLPVLFSEGDGTISVKTNNQALKQIKKAVQKCDNSQNAPVVAFVSKMISIPKSNFNQRGLNQLPANLKDRSLGFARIYSGILKRGQTLYVISPKPKKVITQGNTHYEWDVNPVQVDNLYILMAQHPQGVKQVPAGTLVGIGNLENVVFKSGTISTIKDCTSLAPLVSTSQSILKVAVTTPNHLDAKKLLDGLRKLNKSDPSIEVVSAKNGDIILSTCGEVHLQRCIADLQSIYAQVPVKHSDPIVNFRETITWSKLLENKNGAIIKELANKRKELMKKQLLEKLKKESIADAELDQIKKNKLQAIQDWQMGVEIYQADDFTVTDTRYFLKSKQQEQTEKDKMVYRRQKQLKKTDHKNKGKIIGKDNKNFINLSIRTNVVILPTPNQAIRIKIKALSFPFEISEFLEKNNAKMKEFFASESKSQQKLLRGRQFLKKIEDLLLQEKVDKKLFTMIKENLYCFGPNRCGPNLFLIKGLDPEMSLYSLFNSSNLEEYNHKLQKKSLLHNGFLEQVYCDYYTNERQITNALALGFDIAVQSGPLCQEPIMGACFIVQDFLPGNQQAKQQVKLGKKEKQVKQVPKEEIPSNQRLLSEQTPTIIQVKEPLNQKKQQTFQTVKIIEPISSEASETQKITTNKSAQGVSEENKRIQENSQQNKVIEEVSEEKKPKSIRSHGIDNTKSATSEKKTINSINKEAYGPLAGQMVSTVKEACLQAFIGAGPRLVEPVYNCSLQTHEQYYGKVHCGLERRRAKIIDEDLHASSNLFLIKAQLPVIQSFGYCVQLLTMTQGRVNAQLYFDTWKIYDEDPFYTPLTEDVIFQLTQEIEENGVENIIPNKARILIDKIRKSKGLVTTQKVVSAAQKQRTLSKK